MRLLFLILLTGNLLCAQNLVVNPGFEDGPQKSQVGFKDVEGWDMPSDGTSDYHYYTDDELDTTNNVSRFSRAFFPYEGNACAGFIGTESCHEYIQGSLSEKMIKGQTYEISFAMNHGYAGGMPEERIGLSFAARKRYYAVPGMQKAPWNADFFLDSAITKENDGIWTIYTFHYRATGGEEYFIFGDFWDYDKNPVNSYRATYFNIDNVSVWPYEPEEITEDTTLIPSVSIPQAEIPNEDSNVIAPGKTLVLQNIYFETGKSRILPESYQPLYDIIVEMKLQPNLKVEIVGHTDKHGDVKANQELSEDRAQAVADFFISKGIDASRITTRGCGSSQPVGDDDQKNRRVEFIFSQ